MTGRRRTRERRQPEDEPVRRPRLTLSPSAVEALGADHPLLRAQAQLGNEATRRLVESPAEGGAIQVQRQFTEEDVIEIPPMEIPAEAPDVGPMEDAGDLAGAWRTVLELLDLAGQTFEQGGTDDLMLAYELASSAKLLVYDLESWIASERPEAARDVEEFHEWLDTLLSVLQPHALASAVPPESVQEMLDTVWNQGAELTLALQGLEELDEAAER